MGDSNNLDYNSIINLGKLAKKFNKAAEVKMRTDPNFLYELERIVPGEEIDEAFQISLQQMIDKHNGPAKGIDSKTHKLNIAKREIKLAETHARIMQQGASKQELAEFVPDTAKTLYISEQFKEMNAENLAMLCLY